MEKLLPIFLLLPTVGFLLSLIVPSKYEGTISRIIFYTIGIQTTLAGAFVIWFLYEGMPTLNIKEITIYNSKSYSFFIDLYFDKITATYLMMSSILTYLIAIYSRYYMHREDGYKRFFNTIILFYLGIQIIIFSGNFETLFIGWEVLGVSSFLLIAYYRDRYLPVKNGLKIFSIYRVADIGILLAMWLSHHLWHENITFEQLNNSSLVHEHIVEHPTVGLVIALALLTAASAKSAQLPYSSWLARAMEGPTPSSAIFYGSVAVHIGAFLMLRTQGFWSQILIAKVIMISMGVATSIMATITARTQASVKAQIAYSSIAQIGIIFIEIALGFEWVALFHLTGNAFLRAYQLLISPSVVTYMLREQYYNYVPPKEQQLSKSKMLIRNSLYVIGMKEFKVDSMLYKFLWAPVKKVGNVMQFFGVKRIIIPSIVVFGVFSYFISTNLYLEEFRQFKLPEIFSCIALLLTVKAFTLRSNVSFAWTLAILSHCWIALAVSLNETFNIWHSIFYLSGIAVAGTVGIIILAKLRRKEKFDLDGFYGLAVDHKWTAFLFLICCLTMAGFPISTTFLGEDLIFTHIHVSQIGLAAFVSINFILEGIALMRIYVRIFLGPNSKTYRPKANRTT
ncbi:MAG: NADH-quinone oxidoreductase subunit L [Crocinitomicaceae bacterium]|jgi:NADH-quinone oxidoreductase subunit L